MDGYRFTARWARTLTFVAALSLGVPCPLVAQTTPGAQAPAAPAAPAQAVPTQAVPASPAAAAPSASSATPLAPAVPAPPTPDALLKLPRDLSPWGMFTAADIVVKAVMIGLAFASVLSWTIWFAKALELLVARRRMAKAIALLGRARSWNDAATGLKGRDDSAAVLIQAADAELHLSSDALNADGIKERVASRLERLAAAASRRMNRGTGILATIGATAPFVGLFGTVWGIMNSFIGISKAQTTNLAVVAPGIAEALLATALGLVAAIPAVVMYNFFSRWIAGFRAQHADAEAEILRIIGRDFDRGAFDKRPADLRRTLAAE
jgi:biopolymer transport protein ExbB